MPNESLKTVNGDVLNRLDILISLLLQNRNRLDAASAKRNVSEEATFLHKFGLSYEEISRITGSTKESITELIGRARRAKTKAPKKIKPAASK